MATRAAALDTGAIEGLYTVDRGLTMSVATKSSNWDTLLAEKGPGVRALFEAQLRGYQLAAQFATSETPINEAWIRQLHAEICSAQETYRVLTPKGFQDLLFPKGEYKTLPNHVLRPDGTRHAYSPVTLASDEMRKLVGELRSEVFQKAHPVKQAAYAHYALAAIHPFADGNGRVARALGSTYLIKATGVPLVVFADQRDEYIDGLEAADSGDNEPFVSWIFDIGTNSLELVAQQLRPAPERPANEIKKMLTVQGGLTIAELDTVGRALAQLVRDEYNTQLGKIGITFTVNEVGGVGRHDLEGYRDILMGGPATTQITLFSGSPTNIQTGGPTQVLVAKNRHERYAFAIDFMVSADYLFVRLEDIRQSKASLRMRLEAAVRADIAEMLTRMQAQVAQGLKAGGFI